MLNQEIKIKLDFGDKWINVFNTNTLLKGIKEFCRVECNTQKEEDKESSNNVVLTFKLENFKNVSEVIVALLEMGAFQEPEPEKVEEESQDD